MKKFLIRAGLFLTIIIVFMIVVLKFTDVSLIEGRKKTFLEQREDRSLDLLVLGSSRAEHTFNPKVYAGSLDLFNIGEDGHGLPSNYLMLKTLVEKYGLKPERVLLQADEYTFNGTKNFSRKFRDDFFVTNIEDPEVYEAFKKYRGTAMANSIRWMPGTANLIYNDFGKFLKYHILSYKSIIPSLQKKHKSNVESFGKEKGYKPTSPPRPVKRTKNTFLLEPDDVAYFNKIIDLCKRHNIKLYLYRSPVLYCEDTDGREFEAYIRKVTEENKIPFFDYKCDYQLPDHYFDQTHSDDSISTLLTKDLLLKIGIDSAR